MRGTQLVRVLTEARREASGPNTDVSGRVAVGVKETNTSVLEWYQTMIKHPKLAPSGASAQPANTPEALVTLGNAWLDVRDLAKAHVRAIQREEATGRIIVSAGAFVWHDFCA